MYDSLPSWDEIDGNQASLGNGVGANKGLKTKQRVFLDIFGLVCLMLLVYLFYMILPTPVQYFRPNDPDLMYPVLTPTVPSSMVAILSLLLPLAAVFIYNLVLGWNKYDLYAGLMGALLAYVLALFATATLWKYVGGLRPNFLSICQMDPVKLAENPSVAYYSHDECVNRHVFTRDTFHGFPSGHASTAFAGCVYLSTYLAAHLRLYRNGNILKTFVVLLPLMCACWLSFSRIIDHHHTWIQVLVGIIIGILSGLFAYRLLYVQGFRFGYGKWAYIPALRYNV